MNQKQEEEYWLALARIPGIGPVKFMFLVKHFGSPKQVLEAHPSQWQALGLKEDLCNHLRNPQWHAVEKDIQWLRQPNHHLLTLTHSHYPSLLREIYDPPPILFVIGDYHLLTSPQLAMVGTRHCTQEGERMAWEFAKNLSYQGLTIISGMALGIDAASHRGALAGSGKTIAVAGTGLDRVYPAQHRELAHQIAETGALISEYLPETSVRRGHFPRRSRLISGLSLGTLVVEAPENSGALYTTKYALEHNREVFAIPSSIYNSAAKGCHKLIKQGAKLVETVTDIFEELPIKGFNLTEKETEKVELKQLELPVQPSQPILKKIFHQAMQSEKASLPEPSEVVLVEKSQLVDNNQNIDLNDDSSRLLEYLKQGPTSIDHLVELTGLTAGEVSSQLLLLELRGLVAASGGLYTRLG